MPIWIIATLALAAAVVFAGWHWRPAARRDRAYRLWCRREMSRLERKGWRF